MNYNCPLCTIDPSNHSLVKYIETDNIIFYYTCPAQAKLYYDKEGIIKHYNGILSTIPENKKWIWVIDSKGFSYKHFIEFNIGIELVKLITNKFSKNLLKIIIINPTIYTTTTYKVLHPFISKELNDIIIFNRKCKDINSLFLNY
jgi:hypothetical protein